MPQHIQDVAVILGSVAAVLAALAIIGKWVSAVYKTLKRVNIFIDKMLGDKDRGVTGVLDRFGNLEEAMRAHLVSHAPPRPSSSGGGGAGNGHNGYGMWMDYPPRPTPRQSP